MKPKERVLAAIARQRVDQVPFDYIGTPEIDHKLGKYFGVQGDNRIRECLHVELRHIFPPYSGPELPAAADGSVRDIWGTVRRPVSNQAGQYMETVVRPLAALHSMEEVEAYHWPDPDWYDYEALRRMAAEWPGMAIVLGHPGVFDLINGTAHGRGMEQFLIDLAMREPIIMAMLGKRFSFWYRFLDRALARAGDLVDIVFIGDDYGTQDRMLLSLPMWEEIFADKLRQIIGLVHGYGCQVMLHSCGNNRDLLPRLITLGVDVFQTVQPEAKGMEPGRLICDFGSHMAFHGTISIQKTLPFGTPDDVRHEVADRIALGRDRGGLIVAPAHNIQADTSLENILALYQAPRVPA